MSLGTTEANTLGDDEAADRVETEEKRVVFGSRNRKGEPGGQHSQSYPMSEGVLGVVAEATAVRRTTLARRSVPEELVKLLRSNTLELMLIAPMLNIAALVTRVSVKRGTE